MALDPVTAVIDLANGVGSKLIDRLFPDKSAQAADRARAELALYQLQSDADLAAQKQQLSAIITEAQSTDPWTSRARPSFMYVMYIIILFSIPMGILSAFHPDKAGAITKGMTDFLSAIPEPLYVLFGTGYLGYTAAHSFDKKIVQENK